MGRPVTGSEGGHAAIALKYSTTTINNRDLAHHQLPARGDCEDYRFQPPLTTPRRNNEAGKSKDIKQHSSIKRE